MTLFWVRNKKYILSILFVLIFIITLIDNIPSWVISNRIQFRTGHELKLYDTQGTFWNGSGLLVAFDPKQHNSSPLLYLNWTIRLGFSKFIDMKFSVGEKEIAEVYLNKKGVNLDKTNISLAISQVSPLLGPLKDLNVSGNIRLQADHIVINKNKIDGIFKINLDNISSALSRVNPLGSYNIELDAQNQKINVTSDPGSALSLSGNGTFKGLTLTGSVDKTKKEDMLQFITVMGVPNPDGTYRLKIF